MSNKRIELATVLRLAEQAYKHAAWLDFDAQQPPEEFVEDVLLQFEALLANDREQAGVPFRFKGYGQSVAEFAEEVPPLWRPGWPWHARPKRPEGD